MVDICFGDANGQVIDIICYEVVVKEDESAELVIFLIEFLIFWICEDDGTFDCFFININL